MAPQKSGAQSQSQSQSQPQSTAKRQWRPKGEKVTETTATHWGLNLHLVAPGPPVFKGPRPSILWYASTAYRYDVVVGKQGIDCRRGVRAGWVLCSRSLADASAVATSYGIKRVHRLDVAAMTEHYCGQGYRAPPVWEQGNKYILDVSQLPEADRWFVRPKFMQPRWAKGPEKAGQKGQVQKIWKKEPPTKKLLKPPPGLAAPRRQLASTNGGDATSAVLSSKFLWYASTSPWFDQKIPDIGIDCSYGRLSGRVLLSSAFESAVKTAKTFGISRVFRVDIASMRTFYGDTILCPTSLKQGSVYIHVEELPGLDKSFVRPPFLRCQWLAPRPPVPLSFRPFKSNVSISIEIALSPLEKKLVRQNGASPKDYTNQLVPYFAIRKHLKVDPFRTLWAAKRRLSRATKRRLPEEKQEWYLNGCPIPDDVPIGYMLKPGCKVYVQQRWERAECLTVCGIGLKKRLAMMEPGGILMLRDDSDSEECDFGSLGDFRGDCLKGFKGQGFSSPGTTTASTCALGSHLSTPYSHWASPPDLRVEPGAKHGDTLGGLGITMEVAKSDGEGFERLLKR